MKKPEPDLSRRQFIRNSATGLAGIAAGSATANTEIPASWQTPGAEFSNYGQPGQSRDSPIRWISADRSIPGNGVSWTPLHALEGTITPNGLHFERHHNGVPRIDPASWELKIHGLVNRPLAFTLENLHRYPLISRITFIECGGNSNSLWHPTPSQAPAGYVHGLLSCSEWTGVSLAQLVDEAGLGTNARWLIADGLDASGVISSIPVEKIMHDAIIALYQNGEPLRAENGFPARLLLPGWEGITNIKWLNSLQLADRPLMSRFDTVSYTDLQKDGIAERFSFELGVKSLITSPSAGQTLNAPGFHEIRGLAWTGHGRVKRVDISTDSGRNWVQAKLQEPVLDRALTRFRAPWQWHGDRAILKSRAYDEAGNVQPERSALIEQRGTNSYYHYNAIVSWAVDNDGRIRHVYT